MNAVMQSAALPQLPLRIDGRAQPAAGDAMVAKLKQKAQAIRVGPGCAPGSTCRRRGEP